MASQLLFEDAVRSMKCCHAKSGARRGRSSRIAAASSEPLRVLIRAVEMVTRLVQFIFAVLCRVGSFREDGCNLLVAHGAKAAGCFQRLTQDLNRIASRDYHAGRKVHSIVKTLDWTDSVAPKDEWIAHWLHAQYADVLLHQNGKHRGFKAAEVMIHHVERHLHRIKLEV